jgi:hypothetical protein
VQHADGVAGLPIDYDTLVSHYDLAERRITHGDAGGDPTEPPRGPCPFAPIPHGPVIADIIERLKQQGLHPRRCRSA